MPLNGITVVLTGTKEKYPGISISWVTLVEKDHIVISIPKNSETTKNLLSNKQFSVNILGIGQEEIAKQFGGKNSVSSNPKDKNLIKFTDNGVPILNNCCSNYICNIYLINEIKDQISVIGSIIECNKTNKKPLIYNKVDYIE
jgi:flavin reductase (DIM6/NTAB) family NADH-FMN oxidoreductase RutF